MIARGRSVRSSTSPPTTGSSSRSTPPTASTPPSSRAARCWTWGVSRVVRPRHPGVPTSVTAVGALTETGVDGQLGITLGHGRAMSTLTTTLWSQTPNVASISGTAGRIEIEGTFYAPTSFRVIRHDGAEWRYDGFRGEGKQYQAAEVARCIDAGLTESPA
ncbi:hypothetical protein NKG05_07690 [Oerskovia sp. M15]